MAEAVAQPELFGGFFSEGARSRRREVQVVYKALMEEHGPLLPQGLLPVWLDISRARVSQLVIDGTLPAFDVAGKNYIPMVAVEFFRTSERKAGRPIREKTMGENYRQLWKSFKNSRK